MNSRGSSSVDGIEPSVRERAEAAARRAGMSLNEWLNSTAGGSAPDLPMAQSNQDSPGVADIHQRLDSITRQIDQLSSPTERGEPAVARHLNDAISRLDARLARITSPAPARPTQEDSQQRTDRVERAAAEVYSSSPPLDPGSLESVIAEIAARQHELGGAPRARPPRSSPPVAPAMTTPQPSAPDFSGLERHLFKITSQIEALQRPDGIEQSIAAFRSELAGIRHVITEALPRRAIESIENEIRSLSRRIDDIRQSGSDGQALANIERALNEIHDALRSLKPAEQLAGFDEAIRNLGGKIDTIVRSGGDSGMVQQLENAIGALRGIVSNVASNDALVRLNDDLIMLSSKVDQLGRSDGHGDLFAALEQRVAALTATLETRERPAAGGNSEQLEEAVRALSDRLDRLPAGHDASSALAHLEQRVSLLLERLETAGGPPGTNLGRVEEGLQDILRQLERQQAGLAVAGRRWSAQRRPGHGQRCRRRDQARTVGDALLPVGNRPSYPGFTRGRQQHARARGRPTGDDRRRSARSPFDTCGSGRTVSRRDAGIAGGAAAQAGIAESRAVADGGAAARSDCPGFIVDPAARDQRNPDSTRDLRLSGTTPNPQRRCRRNRAQRSTRICRPIIRWNPAPVRRDAGRRRSASRTPKARSTRSLEHRANNQVHRVSLPRRAGPRRRRLHRRRHPTSLGEPELRSIRRVPPQARPASPPRSARCWSARAWW